MVQDVLEVVVNNMVLNANIHSMYRRGSHCIMILHSDQLDNKYFLVGFYSNDMDISLVIDRVEYAIINYNTLDIEINKTIVEFENNMLFDVTCLPDSFNPDEDVNYTMLRELIIEARSKNNL